MTSSTTGLPGTPTSTTDSMTFRSMLAFFIATFALSWGAGILYVVFQEQVEAIFGPMGYTNPVFIFMVYSPGIVGVLMVWRHYGLKGLGSFFAASHCGACQWCGGSC
ncbi:hypothetical protein [Paeniglutamicibacter sp.]|uniref:hypothetical protein n=1 Tax=Paeniglutamicibacter sp. TaxID=1934391 RepID=UPI0039895B20